MLPLKNYYLVEINIPAPAAGQRIYFGDIPQLRFATTLAIESFTNSYLSLSPTQQAVLSQGGASNIIVTLVQDSTEDIYQIPYNTLAKALNGGVLTELRNKKFNLSKSYITLLGTGSISASNSAVFGFYYEPSQR